MILPAGVFTLELFPEKTRFVCEIMGSMFWTTGLVIMSGIAYLLQDYPWRYLQIVLSCFSLLSLIQYWQVWTIKYLKTLINLFHYILVNNDKFVKTELIWYLKGSRRIITMADCQRKNKRSRQNITKSIKVEQNRL